jgi:NADPH:quinone reductase-like Zn-dependent oxidoreductase
MFLTSRSKEDRAVMHELMRAGKVTPVIDRSYTLNEVPEAIRYLEEGHARRKVVITLEWSAPNFASCGWRIAARASH